MKESTRPGYRIWLIIFAVVFILGLAGIFGVRAFIALAMRYPDMLITLLPDLIRSSVFVVVDAVLGVAAIILAIRGTLKRSTYRVWLLIIAFGFVMHFGLGLITGIYATKFMIRYDFAHHKYEYYNLIGGGIITLIYAGLAVAAIIMSRRVKQSQLSTTHLSEQV